MSFELPPHRWRHIQPERPEGGIYGDDVQWWVCEVCMKATELGRSASDPPEPGTCWGKKPVPPHIKALVEWICGKKYHA